MPYKLDAINRRILYELDKNCRIPDSRLAKMVRRSREAVRNRILKLQQDGIIQGFITSINPSKCGYLFFKLYFQLANIPPEREKFYEYLKTLPGIYWFGGNEGTWDLHGTFYAKSVNEFHRLKNKVYTDFRHLIIRRDIGVLVDGRQYPKKYLLEDFSERPGPAIYAGEIAFNEIDRLDQAILGILSQQARIHLVDLAEKTGSSVDIVRHRLRKLEQKGIIIQYRLAIDHNKLGYQMYKAFVYMNNLSEHDERKLIEYAKQSKNIIYFIRQLSNWDIEIEIMARDYEEFTGIINELRLQFADTIRNVEFALMREDIFLFGGKEAVF